MRPLCPSRLTSWKVRHHVLDCKKPKCRVESASNVSLFILRFLKICQLVRTFEIMGGDTTRSLAHAHAHTQHGDIRPLFKGKKCPKITVFTHGRLTKKKETAVVFVSPPAGVTHLVRLRSHS